MLADTAKIQGRVLLALMLREARTRYGGRQFGYLWALLEPILHISFLSALFTLAGRSAALGESIPVFVATGMATYLGFRNVMNRTRQGYGTSESLLGFPIVKVPDVFMARALLELATWLLATFLILGGLIFLDYGPMPRDILVMLLAIVELFAIGFGAGTVIGVIAQFVPAIGSILKFPLRMLYFVSGVFYLPESMVPAFRDVIAWNPVMHGISLFREGYYKFYDSNMLDREYLAYWAISCVLAALLTTRVAQKPLRSLP